MRNLTARDNQGNEWVQVQKRTAKKLFEAGEDLIFCPCKMYPFGVWNVGMIVDSKRYLAEGHNFDTVFNDFDYYNTSSAQGIYTTFYKRSK